MTPSLFTCTCLLLPYCVLLTFSTGELEFYRDGVPESTEDIALRQFARYLEAQGQQHRSPQRSHFSQLLASQARKKHHLELNRLKERDLLEALAEKANLADLLRKEKLQSWNYHRQYNQPINELPSEREYDLSYYEPNPPVERNFEYPSLKLPYLDHKPSRDDNDEFKAEDFEYPRDTIPKHSFYEGKQFQRGMKEEPTFQFPRSYDRSTMDDLYKDNERKIENTIETTPEFTFKFDDSNLNDKHPFAVKPNDPRYYQDGPFSSDNIAKLGFDETLKNDTKWEKAQSEAEEGKAEKAAETNEKSTKNEEHNFKHVSMVSLPELERRTEHHPLVVPVNHDINNDIYFIAIVAGCSAAAMFILVLISLTWCRLQRGAKAAADIEYPAYGVTGPNKDVSPSGDQRLAQSAQMYHFQHQKQQIIAMENRTSATRDPGSVSEAESDEENEEGDYTVYECPGLASTGEMEVKNPLFHDDPTPATPAQANKEEDHI